MTRKLRLGLRLENQPDSRWFLVWIKQDTEEAGFHWTDWDWKKQQRTRSHDPRRNLFFAFCANNPAPLDHLCAVSALWCPRPFSFINRSVNQTRPPVCGAKSTSLAAANRRWKVMLRGMMGWKKRHAKCGTDLRGRQEWKQLLYIWMLAQRTIKIVIINIFM